MEDNKEEVKVKKDSKLMKVIIIVSVLATAGVIIVYNFITIKKKESNKTNTSETTMRNEVVKHRTKRTNQNIVMKNEIKNTVAENVITENKIMPEDQKNVSNDEEQENKPEEVTKKEVKTEETKNEKVKTEGSKTEEKKDDKKEEEENNKPSNEKSTNSEEKKNETTKTEEKSEKSTEPAKPTKTGTDTIKELTKTETKYGIVTNTYTITTYDVYSDGSKVEKSKKTETETDDSGYSATTSELLAEAKQTKSKNSSKIKEVLKYTNEFRKEANEAKKDDVSDRKDLVLDDNLTVAACVRALEMAYSGEKSHYRPDGSLCFSVMSDMGIRSYTAGENIAWGQTTAKSATTWWKNSSGHYANMINKEYGMIGVGVVTYKGSTYWVQLFTD